MSSPSSPHNPAFNKMDLIEGGAILKKARIAKKITKKNLADAHDISTKTITDIESGDIGAIDVRILSAIAFHLGYRLQFMPIKPANQKQHATQLKKTSNLIKKMIGTAIRLQKS